MTVRATMAALIGRVRTRINDPAGPDERFSDQEIQDDLDRYRIVVRFAPLRPEPFFTPGGITHYLDYWADFGDWERNYQLFDNRFGIIQGAPTTDGVTVASANGTLYSEDLLTGHWVFVVNALAQTADGVTNPMPFGQIPIVRIVGTTYDTWMASAVLLEKLAAKFMLEFTFSSNQQAFYRNQQFDMIMKMAEDYKQHARPGSAMAMREDQTDASALPTTGFLGAGYYE